MLANILSCTTRPEHLYSRLLNKRSPLRLDPSDPKAGSERIFSSGPRTRLSTNELSSPEALGTDPTLQATCSPGSAAPPARVAGQAAPWAYLGWRDLKHAGDLGVELADAGEVLHSARGAAVRQLCVEHQLACRSWGSRDTLAATRSLALHQPRGLLGLGRLLLPAQPKRHFAGPKAWTTCAAVPAPWPRTTDFALGGPAPRR